MTEKRHSNLNQLSIFLVQVEKTLKYNQNSTEFILKFGNIDDTPFETLTSYFLLACGLKSIEIENQFLKKQQMISTVADIFQTSVCVERKISMTRQSKN